MNFNALVQSNPFDWEKQEAAHLNSFKVASDEVSAGKFLCGLAALNTLSLVYAKYAIAMKITFTVSILATSAVVVVAAFGIYLIHKNRLPIQEIKALITLENEVYQRMVSSKNESALSKFNDLIETEYALKVLSTSAKTRSELTTVTAQLKGPQDPYKTLDEKSLISQKGKRLLLKTSTAALNAQKDCEKMRTFAPDLSKKDYLSEDEYWRSKELDAFILDYEKRIQEEKNRHRTNAHDFTVGAKKNYNETAATFALSGPIYPNPLFPDLKSPEQRLEECRIERQKLTNKTIKIKSEIEAENARINRQIQDAYSAALTSFRTELDTLFLK